jgi:acyl-CoA synthetase (AMP-forming)/AMP-acid ligase II
MLDLLRAAAERTPTQPLVISPRGVSTYEDVLADAASIAAGLRERGLTRVGAVVRDAEEIVALLAAASMAGVEVCGYPLEEPAPVLDALAERFDHAVLVAGRDGANTPDGRRLDLADLRSGGPVPSGSSDPTIMILTTGTTGDRRGAIHRWARLAPASPVLDGEPGARWLLAYNLNQFAGIAILLHVLANGATLVQPGAQRAREGVEAIRAHGVTHVSATPTFWRGIVREIGDTDPGFVLRQITLGGEAVPERLLDELRRRFPEARVSQIYAATEFGQTGSVRDGLPGLPESVLHRPDDAPVQLRVDDGELYVRSRVGMVGYYGEPPSDPDAWRPTGDLVEVRDGRLLFVGRTSEVINVGGVKVHPGPVERAVEAVPEVLAACAYGRPNSLTGQIVALEVVLAEGADQDAADAAIREACGVLSPAARPRSIKFVDELATKGQKVNRRVLAEAEK